MRKIPVLIIGAGPVGLSLSLALARQNINSLVIEQHKDRTKHPRARGVSMRSMELFRQWGNIDDLLKYEFPKEAIRFIWCESLQGKEITRIEIKELEQYAAGPITASFVTQDCVEAYLHQTLQQQKNVAIEFSKELLDFQENDGGVTVRVFDRIKQEEEMIHCQYLIAADGAHSRVRQQLDIKMEGPDNLGRFCNVHCEFDIATWTAHRPSIGYFFIDKSLSSRSLFTAYGKNRWIVGMRISAEESKEDFTDEYCVNEIRRVLGIPELNVKIISKSFWTMAAQIATAYRHGNIFLVGDAAHRLPPTGGLGMNTGIQDAHNLAWKLAQVLNHHAADELLDTYYEERAPVAERNIKWSRDNAKRFVEIAAAIHAGDMETLKLKLQEQQNALNYIGLDLGYLYHSKAVLSENDQTLSIAPANYLPTTLPGSRAPHVEMIQAGKKISTLDLFEEAYVLLVGSDGEAWQHAANELAKDLATPLKCYQIGKDILDPQGQWQQVYEISERGAVLVRPDGHVAWRSFSLLDNPKNILKDILSRVNRLAD